MTKKVRLLSQQEIQLLESFGNSAENWDWVLVPDSFNPRCVMQSYFGGHVTIGEYKSQGECSMQKGIPQGIRYSTVVDCELGDNVTLFHVHLIQGYDVEEGSLLMNIDELSLSPDPLFGNGRTDKDSSTTIEPMNECGGRSILPFENMLIADAYLWAKYRDNENLLKKLEGFNNQIPTGNRGKIGAHSLIKNCRELRDVKVGECVSIENACILENLTVKSSGELPSLIANNVILRNGIVGFGAHIEDSVVASNILLGEHVTLERGARLNHVVVGDNSTIACCEVLNSMIFPSHEQHHNNSFLIAALTKGQSNVAAGATIGSNHNSRSADNEIVAGRGFWPGLCSSFKHSSRFASYCLLAKGDYPHELNITLPFSLVNNNVAANRLEIIPAYWWMYNMYALQRNNKKYADRDKRFFKEQHIEFSSFAPDTMEEVLQAMEQIEMAVGKAFLEKAGECADCSSPDYCTAKGREVLNNEILFDEIDQTEITIQNQEKGHRATTLLKCSKAYHAYAEMLMFYALNEGISTATAEQFGSGWRETEWVNLGGQLIKGSDFRRMVNDIENGTINSWDSLHKRYDLLWGKYPQDKKQHAAEVMMQVRERGLMDEEVWMDLAVYKEKLVEEVAQKAYESRMKDFLDPFRMITYENDKERAAVVGSAPKRPTER